MAKRTPIKAIRAKCIDCCGGQMYEVSKCEATECPLFEYRMGHRPKRIDSDSLDNKMSTEDNQGEES